MRSRAASDNGLGACGATPKRSPALSYATLPRLAHCRYDTQLLQHAKRVPNVPALHDLARRKAMYPYSWNPRLLARRFDTREVRRVRTHAGPTRHNRLTVLGKEHGINAPMGVREARLVGGHQLLHSLWTLSN